MLPLHFTWRRWLSGVWQSLTGETKRKRNGSGQVRPRLEALENRLTPAMPSVQSILRTTPAGAFTNATSVTYTVTFDQAVTGVDATDFHLTLNGSVQANTPVAVAGSGSSYTVLVNGISGNGTLGLNLVNNNSIHD